jgi:N-acetylneuraminic acid mutarotase
VSRVALGAEALAQAVGPRHRGFVLREAVFGPARTLAVLATLLVVPACDGGGAMSPDGVTPPAGMTNPPPASTPTGQGSWQSLPSFPGPKRIYSGVGAAGGQIFVVGGFLKNATDGTKADVYDSVVAFDTASKTWSTIAPMPAAVAGPNVMGLGDKLYVLGGLDVNKAFAYDTRTKAWTNLAPQPGARGHGVAAMGVYGTNILVGGGAIPGQSANSLNTGMRVRDFLAYDTATDKWQQLPDLNLARGYCMGAVVGQQFWIIGGSSDFARTDEVVSFDLMSGAWTDGPPPPITLSSAASAVLGNRIYVLGGIATTSGMIGPQTLVLDAITKKWDTVQPMITPRFGAGAAVVDGRIYVSGGVALITSPDDYQPVPTLEVFTP